MDLSEMNKVAYLQTENQNLKIQYRTAEEESHGKSLQINGLLQQIDLLQKKLSKYREGNVDKENLIKEKNDSLERAKLLENQLNLVSLENEDFRKANAEISKDNFNFQKKIKDLEENAVIFNKLKGNLEAKIDQLTKENSRLNGEIVKLHQSYEETKIKALNEIIAELKVRTGDHNIEKESLKNEIEQSHLIIERQNQSISNLNTSLRSSQNIVNELNEKLSKSNLELRQAQELLRENEEKYITLIEQLKNELNRNGMISEEMRQLALNLCIELNSLKTNNNNEELINLNIIVSKLQAEIANKEINFEAAWKELAFYKEKSENLEHALLEIKQENQYLQSKLYRIEEEHQKSQFHILKLSDYIDELEGRAAQNALKLESAYEKISFLTKSYDENKHIENERNNLKEVTELLSEEKNILEKENKQKDAKIKQQNSKIASTEKQLAEQSDTLSLKEQIIVNANKQIEILKKKLLSSPPRNKQVPNEDYDTIKKKVENLESQIKLLKEVIKGLQSDIKRKQQEISKLRKANSIRHSPIQNFSPPRDWNIHSFIQETEAMLHMPDLDELNRESPFVRKKNALNIFKISSPIKQKSKFDIRKSDF
ncbi:unnamed protein product [Blepharisma stoltei]|uniref:Uncharacterized protein n=1 Tax=Blepharisma stoltei TaxID=1481888 RepID=A0AAU9JG87_9CILI|nr:unnamed protein product [Blepharisma stoltei]